MVKYDENIIKALTEQELSQAHVFERIVTEYKGVYDALYYTSFGLSRRQKALLYNKAIKLFKKDLKKLKKIDKQIKKTLDDQKETNKGNDND